MLIINAKLVNALLKQARKDHPIETCGVIAGPEGTNSPTRLIPLRNIAQSTDFFQFDPQQQLQAWREMESRGEEPVVIYHSHTGSEAYPSREDIQYASEPGAHYVIIATHPKYVEEVRSFRIIHGAVTEERVQLIDVEQPEQAELPALPMMAACA